MLHDMLHIPLPLLEKILRPVLVYTVLILLLRLFGKRELAQLNPFDLVLLLMLSNTVQNAIIGDDNSLAGGVVGAIALLLANLSVNRLLFRFPRLNRALQGSETVLVRNGTIDEAAMGREILTHAELLQVIHKGNIGHLKQVKRCVLEPNGTFSLERVPERPLHELHDELLQRMAALQDQIAALRPSAPPA